MSSLSVGTAIAFALGGAAAIAAIHRAHAQSQRRRNNVYETDRMVAEYLVLHYGEADVVCPYPFAPKDATEFPRGGVECIERAKAAGIVGGRALDLGCAVGRTSFELARHFEDVVGLDLSHAFISTANALKDKGEMDFEMADEGVLTIPSKAVVPADINRTRVTFIEGDACNIPSSIGKFDIIFAGNLICRVPDPKRFLEALSRFLNPGGLFVITSPYTIMEQFTPKALWFGGYVQRNADGSSTPVRGRDGIRATLAKEFEFVGERDMPFFIRETSRKNQWTVAHCMVWQRKSGGP
eukprot:Opistho-1_new@16307